MSAALDVPVPAAAAVAPLATTDPVPPYRLEDSVGHLLRRAHQRHAALFQAEACDASVGLTSTQFAALLKLAAEGRTTQNRLGRLVALDPATIQGVAQRLMARGLVAAYRDPLDRRAVVLSVTAAGHALLHHAVARAERANTATLAPLAPAERAELLALLRRLLA